MLALTLREYARLTTEEVKETSLSLASISSADFDELCELNEKRAEGQPPLLRLESRATLSLRNYVGVLELKSGTRLEILPKSCEDGDSDSTHRERALLFRMLCSALGISPREGTEAHIQSFRAPLSEWVIRHFLLELHRLLKQGLRFDYQLCEEERPFLRGRLDVRRQTIQPPQRMHLFHVRHNIFSPDRPEHRLLRRALDRCLSSSHDSENLRLAAPLRSILNQIPPSFHTAQDFRQWNTGRHMAHYQPVKPWCELVLGEEMPFALAGDWRGISMLFPMERLFEKYVASCLRKLLPYDAELSEQHCGRKLCRLDGNGFFTLRPDLLIDRGPERYILDTKWKVLTGVPSEHYGIRQADFYQLFAYGHSYCSGKGDMALVYPMHTRFPRIESPFLFPGGLRLWIIGWDLQSDRPVCPQDSPFAEILL